MAEYRNESLGVVNVGGGFVAPKHTIEVADNSPGLDRLVKRGVLTKVERKPAKSETKDSK
ncbi:MAG: hypothetical protein CL583_07435 [Alteromonadaceae bacterium]|nr:hypothetical protein [Alteromonadaceae bacterium]|tara:strand:- start:670 stop:849 length:180 start_codon:yes stop_codon:yes gene_type:complete